MRMLQLVVLHFVFVLVWTVCVLDSPDATTGLWLLNRGA